MMRILTVAICSSTELLRTKTNPPRLYRTRGLSLAIDPDPRRRNVQPDSFGGLGGNAGQRFRDRRSDGIGELDEGRAMIGQRQRLAQDRKSVVKETSVARGCGGGVAARR